MNLSRQRNKYLVIQNEYISVSIDRECGAIRQIENKSKGLLLVSEQLRDTSLVPWRLGKQNESWVGKDGLFDLEAEWVKEYQTFKFHRDKRFRRGQALDLVWKIDSGTKIRGRIEIPKEDPNAYFYAEVESKKKKGIARLEYPIIQGVGTLGKSGEKTHLAHPHASGILFHNPSALFKNDRERPMSVVLSPEEGLPFSYYPEGYAGSAMQFMVYYVEELGGFYMACHDPRANLKSLNFYRNKDGLLEISFIHEKTGFYEQSFKIGYPTIIGSLFQGNWYEGADRYKEWAIKQEWCNKGPLWKRVKEGAASKWLAEQVGFCTFGINSRYDRSSWLKFFHDITGKPVFHVLGVNWSKVITNYVGGMASTPETWFPAEFNRKNLEMISNNGDYWAPFEFDILFPRHVPKFNEMKKNLLLVPRRFGYGVYFHGYICPFTQYLLDFHAWRDEKLVKEYGADANYYDISFSNVLMACFNKEHGHPVGGGGWMVEGWRRLAIKTKQATTKAKGRYVPQGTEVVIEPLIDTLDFYQARANGSPCSPMEIDPWREWIKQGKAEKIPMFDYVYHEYGPIRMDGWLKISNEIGDIFYWIAGRTALWGGLVELNYEFSPLEVIDQSEYDRPEEHYYPFKDRRYVVDSKKLEFIREVAYARTNFAKDYLAYGTMIKPLKIRCRKSKLDWFLYNTYLDDKGYEERGAIEVPNVVHSAWRFAGKLGFLFLNIGKEPEKISVTVNQDEYELNESVFKAILVTKEQAKEFKMSKRGGNYELNLKLPPRKIILLELKAQSDTFV